MKAASLISPYLTSAEAVDYLRLSPRDRAKKGATKDFSGLYRLMREHRLPYVRRGGRLLFDSRELDTWMRENAMRVDLNRVELQPAKALGPVPGRLRKVR